MRSIQDRYDAVGHVPREAVRPLDERMRAAEQRVRDATDTRRRRDAAASNPLLDRMREAVAKAEVDPDPRPARPLIRAGYEAQESPRRAPRVAGRGGARRAAVAPD